MTPSPARDARIRRRRRSAAFGLLTAVAPLPTLRALRYEGRLTWLRMTRRGVDRRFEGETGLLVNAGCGPHGLEGWVNVDAFPEPGVTCVRDCRTGLPLPTGSARGIFTEHFVEHLDYYEQAPRFLVDCRRALEPGGVLRVIVPDGAKYLAAYVEPGWERLRSFSPLVDWDPQEPGRPLSTLREVLPFRTKMEVVNWHFHQAGQHRFSYDYETMEQLLTECGFVDVARASYRQSRLPELAIDRDERAAESLVVEASAPG